MAKDFEYNLDELTRLMEEQALGSPHAQAQPQGERPRKKSKISASAKTVRECRR